MIVPMKKVTLICLAPERDTTLDALREIGVLHIAPVTKPEGVDLDRSRKELAEAESVGYALGREPQSKGGQSVRPPPAPISGPEIVEQARRHLARRKELSDRIETLRAQKEAIEPYGDFDPGLIGRLRTKGVAVRLFAVRAKEPVSAPEGAVLLELGRDSTTRYIALIGGEGGEFEGKELPAPELSLTQIAEQTAGAERELGEIGAQMLRLSAAASALAEHVSVLKDKVQYLETLDGMGASNKVSYLQGFCPVNCVDPLRKAAASHGWGLVVGDPSDQDAVPTLIRNPVWLRPIQSLFDLMSILPGYREADVSVSFLFFFSLFFAMIVGDAGYGCLFLAATLLLRRKFRRAPPEPFRLLMVFSVCTIVWGVLCGVYFGAPRIPALLERFHLNWLDDKNVMRLSLLIGAIHLSVAHLWNVVRMINSTQAIAQAGWATVMWSIFFGARALLFETPFPSWYVPISILGGIAAVVFMVPFRKLKTDWINLAMLPLTLMSYFGDILSYLRLWALGVASVKLAGAFNDMALNLGFGDPLAGLMAVLILFVGHGLNILLGCLSVLVHGIRLNALEFSSHFGIEWAGVPYKPFARRPQAGNG